MLGVQLAVVRCCRRVGKYLVCVGTMLERCRRGSRPCCEVGDFRVDAAVDGRGITRRKTNEKKSKPARGGVCVVL